MCMKPLFVENMYHQYDDVKRLMLSVDRIHKLISVTGDNKNVDSISLHKFNC